MTKEDTGSRRQRTETTQELKSPLPMAFKIAGQDLRTQGEKLLRLAKDMPDGLMRVRLSGVITRVFAAGETLAEMAEEVERDWPKTEVDR